MPSHYLDQCWDIVNWTQWNKFSEIWIEIQNFTFRKMHLKMLSTKWQPVFPVGMQILMVYKYYFHVGFLETFFTNKQWTSISRAFSSKKVINLSRLMNSYDIDYMKCIYSCLSFQKISATSNNSEWRNDISGKYINFSYKNIIISIKNHYISMMSHDMEMFSVLLVLCEDNLPVTGRFPGAAVVSLTIQWTVQTPVICNAMTLIWHLSNVLLSLLGSWSSWVPKRRRSVKRWKNDTHWCNNGWVRAWDGR